MYSLIYVLALRIHSSRPSTLTLG
ncbi:hypothetical protein Ocin01_12688 [Orchesella cincta]|uniref:Uncharacterized protein n=1 Tax=Orchesella cincta TaxID=48709 RepID=A0A1D2MMA8_ORCCI|nr:hypothetical protein Ocin01_12688 [Orchesella cincta]